MKKHDYGQSSGEINVSIETLVALIEFTGGDATDIIEWHKAEIVLDKITKIITESKHGFESPVANVNIIEALLEYKKD